MAAKPALSFGFAKKAEPKRHVAALSTKKVEEREEIRGVEEGQLALEKPKEGQGPPVIKCKNLLDGSSAPKKLTANLPDGTKRKVLEKPLEECAGGIVTNIEKLSSEDAEAMRELLKDAAREGDGEEAPVAMPILMKEGSKKARDGTAPDASKEMFENVSVETFGEAMLRGMGFDPNVHQTKPVIRDKLRDTHLGLGAKALLPGEKAQIKGKKKNVPVAPKAAVATSGSLGASSGAAVSTSASSAIAAASADVDESSASGVIAVEAEPGASSTSAASGGAVSSEPGQKRRRTEDADAVPGPGGASSAGDVWASRGLVVRVISKEGTLRNFFGAEAVVLEVDESGTCRIKARPNGGDKSEQLKGVPLQHIETRVSRDCQKVRVVRGAQKGLVARLLKRDAARGVAVLRIEGAERELPLDDVCQFME